jgi:S-adenosylmethionine/arginine decarboxylase-like enzyme
MTMPAAYSQLLTEFVGLQPSVLSDSDTLGAVLVAAAGAMGVAALGPPVVRRGTRGFAAALICGEGHVVLHTIPDDGSCLVDIVARGGAAVDKGLDVIARRLGVQSD